MADAVIDPEVPDDVRRALESATAEELIPFSASPSKVASLRNATMRQARLRKRVMLLASGIWAILLVVLYFAVPKFSADPGHLGTGAGRTFAAVCLVAVSAIILGAVGANGRRGPRPAPGLPSDSQRKAKLRADNATAYHRRYVVPERDLHADALSRWHRASSAAAVIHRSEAVRAGWIDSIEVDAVLPYHLWEMPTDTSGISCAR
jgi:hypothetical protein